MSGASTLRIVEIFPGLLGTYGDHGNLLVLADRARRRGFEVETSSIAPGQPIPAQGDIYLIGGGEDAAQTAATGLLRSDPVFSSLVAGNRPMLAVCAGLQMLGSVFPGLDGKPVSGLDLVDLRTVAGRVRAVGEIAARPAAELELPTLTGFENHQGRTQLGVDTVPLARVLAGIGNGDGREGVVSGRLIGTYLHGPVLVRNPALADLLLSWAVGPVAPLAQPHVEALRAERLRAVRRSKGRLARLARLARPRA